MHLGIIMDGNRRWAEERGLPVFRGHWRGAEKIEEVVRWCMQKGIRILTVYAFSVENWNRSPREVNYLMKLGKRFFLHKIKKMQKEGIRVRVIGQREKLNSELRNIIWQVEALTQDNDKFILNLAISYGGRAEIIQAVRGIVEEGIETEEITEKTIEQYLWTVGLPDPDLIIRTSGEQRTSGFLMWQSVYSELYFTKTYWPDFSEQDLDAALADYAQRQRRFGE